MASINVDCQSPSYTVHDLKESLLFSSSHLDPLKLPQYPTKPDHVRSGNGSVTTDLINAHYLAFEGSHRVDPEEWTMAKAMTEMYAVSKAFPLVQHEPALLAMTAWFHLLCKVDNEVEDMESEAARSSLQQSMNYIQRSCDIRADGLVAEPIRPCTRARALRSRHDSVTESSLAPSGAECTAVPSPRPDSLTALRDATVQALTKAFVQQIHKVLIPSTVCNMAARIIDVWRYMCAEVDERETTQESTLEAYLVIRAHTIGLLPFFAILEDLVCTEIQTELGSLSSDPDVVSLRTRVAHAVGLQNDIVGLEKDLATGEQLNLVRLLQARDQRSIEDALLTVIRMHNDAVTAILDHFKALAEDSTKAHLLGLAESIVMFIRTHYAWATRSKRYQA